MDKIHDISQTISSDLFVWHNDRPIEIDKITSITTGDPFNTSLLKIGTHIGSHVDAPSHFILGGKSVDQLSLHTLIGSARLLDLSRAKHVDSKILRNCNINEINRLLIKTRKFERYCDLKPNEEFACLTQDGAEYIVGSGIKLIGLDNLSVDGFTSKTYPIHTTLLKAGIVIIEGLSLGGIEEGDYELICLPLKIRGADGSPARVILRKSNG